MNTTIRLTLATAAAALMTLAGTSTAAALPPGGANTTDTAGTTSTVSPRTLAACETLSYTVTGFPAGETVNVKIDDGIGYGDEATQGTGVISQVVIGNDGVASGSFELPCDIPTGEHWLRFLATDYQDGGTAVGYSNRGDSDFRVVTEKPATGGGNGGMSSFASLSSSR